MKTWNKKLNGYFIAFVRRVFHWSPAYKECLKRAFVKRVGKTEFYKCAGCGDVVPRKKKQVDHISAVVPLTGWKGDWNLYRDRMSMENPDNLQVLCKVPCHKEKTANERKLRKAVKK